MCICVVVCYIDSPVITTVLLFETCSGSCCALAGCDSGALGCRGNGGSGAQE